MVKHRRNSNIFALQPIRDGWMFGHCNAEGRHSAYFYYRSLLLCEDVQEGRAGAVIDVWLGAQDEEWDLGVRCDEILVVNETAVADGKRFLVEGARVLAQKHGWEDAGKWLNESQEAYSRGVRVPLDVCQDAYAQAMQRSLMSLGKCGWGEAWSRLSDDHCVTVYDLHDWMYTYGGAAFVEWLHARMFRHARYAQVTPC
jgi:hypothetical protein